MRFVKRLVVALSLLILLIGGPAYAFFSLSSAKNAMVDFLLEQLSTEGEFVITAEEVKELDEGSTAITGLKIADADGVWFTAGSLKFNWNPSRLLSGEVEFSDLSMSDVEVLRSPVDAPSVDVKEETGPPEDDGAFAWPRSPLTIRIERLALERVNIAKAVLGHAISFDAEGSARDEGDIQAAGLKLTRTDRIAGKIDFSYSRNFADNTLKVDLTANEAEGGLVAHLADLPDDAASNVTLKAAGPPTDWRVKFDLDLADTVAADGRATVSYEGLISVDAAFNARPGPQLPEDIAILLGDRADLAAKITQDADGTLRIAEGRIASPELKLTADGSFAPNTGVSDLRLTLDAGARLAEPFDGIDFGGLRFDGTITGPTDDVRARGALKLDGLRTAPVDVGSANLTIDVRSAERGATRRTVLDVVGRTTGLRLDKIPADTIGDADLVIKGTLDGDDLSLERAGLDSKLLSLAAGGTGDLAANVFDLEFSLSTPNLTPIAGAYGTPVTGAIALKGTFRQLGERMDLNAGVALTDFSHPMAEAKSLRLDGTVGVNGPVTTFDLSGRGEALRLDQIDASLLPQATLSAKGNLNGDALKLDSFALNSPVVTAKGTGRMQMDTGDADFDFSASAPDLAPVAGAYGTPAKGAIAMRGQFRQRGDQINLNAGASLTEFAHEMADAKSLTLDGSVELAGKTVRFDLKGRGEALRLDKIDAGLLPQATLSAVGTMDDGTLKLDSFALASPLIRAAGAGQVEMESRRGRLAYEIAMPDLGVIASRYDTPLSGELSMRGAAAMPGGDRAPRLDGTLGISGLRWDGTGYGNLSFDHDVEVSESPSGKLGLRLANSPYGDVRLNTGFAFSQPRLTLSGLDADALGIAAAGDLVIKTDGPLVDGRLKVNARTLAPAGRLAGTPLNGSAWGTILLNSTGGAQNVDAALDVRKLSVAGTEVAAADVNARLRDVLGQLGIDARVRATGIATGPVKLTNTRLSVRGPLSGLSINAETSGIALDKSLLAVLQARVDAAGPITRARIGTLDVTLAEERIGLAAPLQITSGAGVTRLRGLDAILPDQGRLAGDVTIAGRPIAGALSLRLPNLAMVKRFADVPVKQGAIDADVTFDRRGGKGTLDATGLVFEDVDAPGALSLSSRADWSGRRLSVEGDLAGGFGDPLRVTATLPLARAGGLPEVARRGPIKARVKWVGEIGELWALVPAPGHVLTGKTDIDLGVAGDISNPKLNGGVRISDGSYQNLDLGTILTKLSVETTLLGGGDLGLKLSASDGAKGKVTVDGRVALDASGIDLTTTVDQAVLVRRDDVIARVDGNVAIIGPATALAVTGKLVIPDAEVRLVNASTPSIITLENVRIKGAPVAKEKERNSSVTLDLSISSPGRIFVRGRGLDSQWGMNLSITGKAASPVILGAIERERGKLDLIGKTFDLERGSIRFDGAKKIDPIIDVALVRSTSDITGSILVTGRASKPELDFTSTPSLPSDEIMPRLLFGKSRQALTGSQAIQLSLGLATLMDGGAGTLDTVRSAVGVDQLRVDQDEDGNASVTVGKEVADGVFVGTERSLGDGGTKVTVEIDVFEGVTIDTEIDSEGGASVGVEWKKDF